ncbi:rab protein geranylgeranyltransferase component A [Astrocystis sublimbata]|nr:rab protein geranylgeranyltransferase component A [Astrocystis sublimbata]
MESLGEETWDAVLCGTGLSQSLLALALSRSSKRIIHIDANDFYGEHEAALSLQEADAWAQAHAGESGVFQNAQIWMHSDAEGQGLSFPRAYSLALAPQIIHTRSELLARLVSSKAYRQVEFLAVGSFYVYDTRNPSSGATLTRIPSSREDVFSARDLPAKSKRALMKFLRHVIDYESDEQKSAWQDKANKPLSEYLISEFKLDESLQDSILSLTLTLDGMVTVKDGLASIHRHLTSFGLFGPGFCAVYPKWGGSSEIAQVGCRAGAVGGGIYMLNTPVSTNTDDNSGQISLTLPNDVVIRTNALVSSQQTRSPTSQVLARLVAVLNSPLQQLFEVTAEGTPTPAVIVVAFPANSLRQPISDVPVYAFVHSSETGECPTGQSIVYLTMDAKPKSAEVLEVALKALLQAMSTGIENGVEILYKLFYEQATSGREPVVTTQGTSTVFEFPAPSLGLAFNDGILSAVQEAWKVVTKGEALDDEFMKFEDREGMGDDDDVYD